MEDKIERVYPYKMAVSVPNYELDFEGGELTYRSFWQLLDARANRGKRPTLSILFPLFDSYSAI